MRILLINTYYHPNGKGGAERSTKILADTFLARGYDVSVITSSNRNYFEIVDGVKVYYLNMGNLYWLSESKDKSFTQKIIWHLIDSFGLNSIDEFLKTIELINPNIVITNNLVQFSSKIWKILDKRNFPFIHIIRDHYQLNLGTTLSDNIGFIRYFFLGKVLSIRKKRLSNYVKFVVGISDYILNKHIEYGYFRNNLIAKTIHNPLPEININRISKQKRVPIFGYVGELNFNKGVDLVINEFINGQINNELLIFGSGKASFVNNLKESSLIHKNLKIMGYKSVNEIFSQIDYLIVPSLINEAFGRVIIEAYSYGVPVIGSNRGGIPELIDKNQTGFLFNPEVEGDLVKTIKSNHLDEFLFFPMVENCYLKAQFFRPDYIIDQYIDLFQLMNNDKL
jgi:glycosyltransferase involved in cell wall biosynthesis